MNIREIEASAISEAVARLCAEACYKMTPDIRAALERARGAEDSELARGVLGCLLENADIAAEGVFPLCQDCGMALVFAEVGQDAHITGGTLRDAVNDGVRAAYTGEYLRKSVVRDPIDRVNTGDNTPAVLWTELVAGDRVKLMVAPKGFGSENKGAVALLTPSQGIEGVKNFIVETVKKAGPDPCPPMVIGAGVGGTAELAALNAKRAMLREIGTENKKPFWAGVERELLERVNELGIGPAGLGGRATALALHIEAAPTHIAGLPVAVAIGCHSTRHASAVL